MVTVNATIVLAQNGYTTSDFSAVNIEYMMDDAINTLNLLFSQSIAALSGGAGVGSTTLTRSQSAVFAMLMSLVLRENKKTALSNSSSTSNSTGASSSVGIGGLSASESSSVSSAISAASAINNPANSVYVDLLMKAGRKLELATVDPPIYVSNAPIPG